MNYLLALIPAIGWGIMPLITGKIGGSTINQIFGIGAGATIVGLVAFIIGHPTVTTTGFWFSVLCGALWTIGQIGQFVSFKPRRQPHAARCHVCRPGCRRVLCHCPRRT